MAQLKDTEVTGALTINDGTETIDVKEELDQLNSDLNSKFNFNIYTASYTVAANGTTVVDVPVDDLTSAGYTMVAITPIVNSSYVSASVKATESTKIQILLKSSYSSSLTSNFTVRVLRMK